jgi:cell division protein FtsI (penicillin-binding protein 3)
MLGSRVTPVKARAATAPRKATRQKAVTQQVPSRARSAKREVVREARQPSNVAHRPVFILFVIVLAASGLIARLVFWQVMQHAQLSARVQRQQALYIQAPTRGIIVDARNSPLATDVPKDLLYAVPKNIKDPHQTAVELAPILGWKAADLEQALTGPDSYRQLAPEVTDSVAQQVRNLALPGIVLYPEMRRTYPGGSTAANVLGFVDVDGNGRAGIEAYYNNLLTGRMGLQTVVRDTAGNAIKVSSAAAVPSHDGAQLQLSIDGAVQALAENELRKAVKIHRADGGSVIVMDPRTGYILAMANTPTYNPNQYFKVKNYQAFQNPAVEMQYEPGSTFKIITMAAGLDTGVITPLTSFYDNGVWTVDGIHLHNWSGGAFGQENMTQVLQHSANVGASFVASRLQTGQFYKYVHLFGFGKPTGIDTSDEVAGQLLNPGEKGWTVVNLFTNSFGQGIAVTPIQMIQAVSAVANHGLMMKPRLVKQVVYDGQIVDKSPTVVRRVVSALTAHTLTNMLVHSAIGGEAQFGLVKGYNIAAKTGTANIPAPSGGYIPNATIGSIVGYAPAFHPRFVVLVIVKHPRDQPWGSMTAAPVLHDLFQELFLHYHIPPNPFALYK